ncbi:IS1634 family transposase [Microcoleus sp. herbarium5]
MVTASNSKAVQVIYYVNRKRIVFKHIGSARTESELETLHVIAQDFIDNYSPELPFKEEIRFDNLLYLHKTQFIGIYYTQLYEVLLGILVKIGLSALEKQLLLDLVVIRIVEPASKLRSIELMDNYFGIKHRRQSFYKSARNWLTLKHSAEKIVTDFAKRCYDFNFELVFYDVTTLYFETFQEDELRKNGFSKDNKSQQPQVLVALMVTKEGFPISYEVFSGNTFEGHTILPVVKSFIEKHQVQSFTIVADAAMISSTNVKEFNENQINYIVGARIANLSGELISKISRSLNKEDGKNIRVETDKGSLVCSFSAIRYRKDKYEMEKQIEKAKSVIETPSKGKKLKFTKSEGEELKLNQSLIEKTNKLLGLKGYYTNLKESELDNNTIIQKYHELYRIEQAFRIAKSDLQTRPIFHYKEEPINLHLLICFMALVVSKYIELETGISIKKFKTEMKKVTDARMLNQINNKELRIRAQINPTIKEIIGKLNLPH